MDRTGSPRPAAQWASPAMARYKRRRRRARGRSRLEQQRDAANPQGSVCPSPRSPADVPLSSTPVPRCSLWSLALPSIRKVVKLLTSAAAFLCWWGQNTVAQVQFVLLHFQPWNFKVVKDTIFPSQIYLRELNTLREQLEKLESEFAKLQGTLQAPPVKQDGPLQITLKDLLNVKLKKTKSNLRMDQMAHPKSPSPARLSAANSFDEK
ncbi:hypothetical protein WISP_39085 [Willisornis vidua]|uniref:Uncharacterized protein n=1 Tax=Willisornis vidua TaxID=1566151 RepID=A0ABQ9DLZ2_9PASS|nr:hypothetical protein WISP_39085 [Willisornis vidua]